MTDKTAFLGIGKKLKAGRERAAHQAANAERAQHMSTIAGEVDARLKKDGLHVSHAAIPNAPGMGALESHGVRKRPDGSTVSIHSASDYLGSAPKSIRYPTAPRGFTLVLKKQEHGGIPADSVPKEYKGDHPKIDWTYLHTEEKGKGLAQKYYEGVEAGARKAGYPRLHVDATNAGVSFWAQPKFGLQPSREHREELKKHYAEFRADPEKHWGNMQPHSRYLKGSAPSKESLPDVSGEDISKYPRSYLEYTGARVRARKYPPGAHVHLYKKLAVRNPLAGEFLKLSISAGILPDIVEPSPGSGTVFSKEAPQFRHSKAPPPMRKLIKAALAETEPSQEKRKYWTEGRQKARAERVFKNFHGRKNTEGVLTGAGKYRIAIPKHVLTKTDLEKHLGFVPVNIAVPESGQKQFGSWRHPYNNNHLHDHGSHWVMHEDDHASSTMLVHRRKLEIQKARERAAVAKSSGKGGGAQKPQTGLWDIAKTTIQGLPHVIGEGVPGMASYTRNRIMGGGSMLDKVQNDLPRRYHRRVRRMKASPTYQRAAAGSHEALEQVRHLPHKANAMRQNALRKQAMSYREAVRAGHFKQMGLAAPAVGAYTLQRKKQQAKEQPAAI